MEYCFLIYNFHENITNVSFTNYCDDTKKTIILIIIWIKDKILFCYKIIFLGIVMHKGRIHHNQMHQ